MSQHATEAEAVVSMLRTPDRARIYTLSPDKMPVVIEAAREIAPERVTPPLHKLSPSAPQMRRIVRHCNARRCPNCRRKAWDCRCG